MILFQANSQSYTYILLNKEAVILACSETVLWSPFLNSGISFAIFISSGNILDTIDALKMNMSGS